jgi:hypothetical protein
LFKSSKTGVALALLFAGSMWFYFQRVLVPHQRSEAAVRQAPRGNLSDLYPRWLGAQELLLHGRDPYSAEVTREIQVGYYGRELDPSRPGDPKDQQAFAYPVYVVLLLAPTVEFPFRSVRIGFEWLLIVMTAAGVWLWVRAFQWRPLASVGVIATVLVLGSFEAVQGIKLDQLSLLVAGMIGLCAALLTNGYLFTAGIVLAIATIKPQLVAPLVVCLLFWAATNWAKRQRFALGFGLAMIVLLGGAEVILQGWMTKFWAAMGQYLRYTGGMSLLDLLLSPLWGRLASLALLLGLALTVWRFRWADPQTQQFSCLLASVLAATLIVVPMVAPYNQILLVPAMLLVVREWRTLWNANALAKALCMVTVLAVGWQWAGALALVLVSFWLPSETVQKGWTLPLHTILVIPFVLLFQMAVLVGRAWTATETVPSLACND